MCMEDLRIGCASVSSVLSFTIDATSAQFLPPNARRRGLHFQSPIAGTITVSPYPNVALGSGVNLQAFGVENEMNIETHGLIIQSAWHAIADMAGRVLTIIEIELPPDFEPWEWANGRRAESTYRK